MKVSWGVVGTGIATFIGGVAATVGIYQAYKAPKGDLRGSIVANAYASPPTTERRQGLKDTVVKRPLLSLLRPTPESLIVTGGEPEGFLNGRVENGGSKEVKQVVMRIPDALSACVKREPEDWKCQGASSVIALGDLAPLESVAVQVWLRSKPDRPAYESMKLIHSEGVGSIDFDTVDIPFGFIRRHFMWFFFGTMLAILLVGGLLSEKADRDFQRGVAWAKRQEDVEEMKRTEIRKQL